MCKRDYSWNPSTCICENSRYLKSFVDGLVIVCKEIINVTDSVSTNVTNTISTNVASAVSINSDDKIVNGLSYFALVFIGDHISFYNLNCLL